MFPKNVYPEYWFFWDQSLAAIFTVGIRYYLFGS